jgi:tetratricopeptide (TPR) repeat protein
VPAETAQMLRTAALLGGRFTVTDLAVVLRRPVSDLAAGLQEATAAGILAGSGSELVFRHPLIRQALYESTPTALRTALHAEAAQELAASGADALSVAQQLSAASRPGGGWARAWLIQATSTLTMRAPQLAAQLLRRELDETPADDEGRDFLVGGLVRALHTAGSYQEVGRQARRALTVMTDPAQRGEMSLMLAHALWGAGNHDDAARVMRQALAAVDLPRIWQARLLALLGQVERLVTDFDTAESISRRALTAAEETGDPFAIAQALYDLWLIHSVRRVHAAALDNIDQALGFLGDDPDHADLRSIVLDCRTFTLQNLDEWPQAELALREAREFDQRTGRTDRATWAVAAVLRYWLGQWDDALAELGSDSPDALGPVYYSFLRERWSALLMHGVAALIAGRREQRTTASEHLRKGLALPIESLSDRENRDFLLAAHALSLEQSGKTRQAMLTLAEMVPRRDGEMTLTHQWLPDLVRLALAAGDRQVARGAAQACQEEAAAETSPARAAAASLRCRGLLRSDPGAVRHARAP